MNASVCSVSGAHDVGGLWVYVLRARVRMVAFASALAASMNVSVPLATQELNVRTSTNATPTMSRSVTTAALALTMWVRSNAFARAVTLDRRANWMKTHLAPVLMAAS